jgi:integrase
MSVKPRAVDLSDVFAKLDWAERHIETFRQTVEDFEARKPAPFGFRTEKQPRADGSVEYELYAIVRKPPPRELALIAGDVAHNVRSALDHLVYALSLAKAQRSGKTQFPIFTDECRFKVLGVPMIESIKGPERTLIENVQPFAAAVHDTLTRDERPARAEKTQPHGWTDREIDELLQAAQRIARQPESRQDYTPLLRLTARLGLRPGEVLGLQWGDFDKAESVLHVQRQWCLHGEYGPTKTAAGVREIPLPHDLRDELIGLRLASSFSQDSDPVFASRTGSPLGHRNVTRRAWEAARDLAGLPESLTFHQLRHAAASRLIATGLDPVTVASVLGHDDPSVNVALAGATRRGDCGSRRAARV